MLYAVQLIKLLEEDVPFAVMVYIRAGMDLTLNDTGHTL